MKRKDNPEPSENHPKLDIVEIYSDIDGETDKNENSERKKPLKSLSLSFTILI